MDFGGLISAGANLLGGLLGQKNQAAIAQKNIDEQRDFAQHGIEWKVDDAKRAGINPLAALGAQTSSFSNIVGDNSLASGVSAAGQDLGRAANALTSKETKADQLNEKLLEAKIKNVEADTVTKMALASQTAVRHGQPGTVSVPLPNGDPRGPVKRLTQRFIDDSGRIWTLPSGDASTAMQNLATAPMSIPIGGNLVLQNAGDPTQTIVPPAAATRSLWPSSPDDVSYVP